MTIAVRCCEEETQVLLDLLREHGFTPSAGEVTGYGYGFGDGYGQW
jgi:hypothetical protein